MWIVFLLWSVLIILLYSHIIIYILFYLNWTSNEVVYYECYIIAIEQCPIRPFQFLYNRKPRGVTKVGGKMPYTHDRHHSMIKLSIRETDIENRQHILLYIRRFAPTDVWYPADDVFRVIYRSLISLLLFFGFMSVKIVRLRKNARKSLYEPVPRSYVL